MKHSAGGRKTPSKLSESTHHRLNMYALAASAAGVGALIAPNSADAKIVYTPTDVKINGVYKLDLNHDGKTDFLLVENGCSSGPRCSYIEVCANFLEKGCDAINSSTTRLNQVRVNDRYAMALWPGVKVNDGTFEALSVPGILMGIRRDLRTSTNSQSNWAGPWVDGGKGVKNRYLGLKFEIDGKFHFGWARLRVKTANRSITATLTGYAYETIPGKSINAGQTKSADDPTNEDFRPSASLTTPIPDQAQFATLGALASGALGLSIWRREESLEVTQ
jgi:hypothetical protein